MAAPDVREPPPDWAGYALTNYFDGMRVNQFATFHNKRILVQDICRLDRLFADALQGWRDPPSLVPALLLLRSHAAFRASAGASLAGQLAETPCLLRLCLECAGYAAVIGQDQTLAQTFLRRSESEMMRKKVRAAFNPERIKAAVGSLWPTFKALYDGLIDFGAHPNEDMIIGSLRMDRRSDETSLDAVYLHGDGPMLDVTLKRTIQVGLWSALVLSSLFPKRAAEVSAAATIDALRPHY